MTGGISLLTTEALIRYIFGAYWNNLFLNPIKFAKFYRHLRQDEWWRTNLRWFYRQQLSLLAEISGQFELMGWLNCPPQDGPRPPHRAPEDLLGELIRFVTFTAPQGFDPSLSAQPFAQIQILIDGTESLSAEAVKRLIVDAQRLYKLYPNQMQFKLFASSAWQSVIAGIDFVRQGRVAVYRLPAWNEQDLRRLLSARLKAFTPGEYRADDDGTGYEWGKLIPETHLERAAQTRLVEIIVQNAANPPPERQNKTDLDAPIHVLRLARSLVAACAGYWKQAGFKPPLTIRDIEMLTKIYWNPEGDE